LASLWLRSASRILVRLAEVNARDFPTLFQRLARLPWGRYIHPGAGCDIRVSAHASRLGHTGRIAQTCQDAIDRALGAKCSLEKIEQKVFLRFFEDRCQVSIDSSGDHLHRRGYHQASVAAPLRENLAAGCLLAGGYDGSEVLVDPLTGSGTFVTEAALIALRRAPGQNRAFAFMQWPKYRQGLWRQLQFEARREERSELPQPIFAADNNSKAIEAARKNIESLGLGGKINLYLTDMQKLLPPAATGMLIANPPYGERLGRNASLKAFYRDIGDLYGRSFSGWKGLMLCPESELVQSTGLNFEPVLRISNGGIKVALLRKNE
jgi:putative N6-adenine-specific DNA methylase